MINDKYYYSVRLDESLCKGCINCIKRCPTGAIRVRNGKAVINKSYCIDCGECIRICPHHAKHGVFDPLEVVNDYEYTVALPAPSLFGQFNNLDDINIVLTALKRMGFDDVYEVSRAAELVSEISREYVAQHTEKWPLISTACPSVVRLIRVRFPNLIEHLLPIMAPVDLAARLAREEAMEKTGLPSEKIGIIFISPCPAKVSASKTPLGLAKSEIDAVLAMKDIYPNLLLHMNKAAKNMEDLSKSGRIGISWGSTGGEAGGLLTDSYLAADGIENVIHVLEGLEDQKFTNLEFIELNACNAGCVGGVFTVENPYVAKAKIKKLRKYLAVANNHWSKEKEESDCYWTNQVEYEPVYNLSDDMKESIAMMAQVEELCTKFPGIDCGSCGAPSCRALAEDIVRGDAREQDCIHILREHIRKISEEFLRINSGSPEGKTEGRKKKRVESEKKEEIKR